MAPVAQWWHCLPPQERGAIVGIYGLIAPPVYAAPCVVVDLIIEAMGVSDDREAAFRSMFQIECQSGLPFPPPLDCQCVFTPAVWTPIYEYIRDNGSGFDNCLCGPLAQPGQQGGAWPECWP